jgi:glycosyltransferase involved in cell wall biosynthesis
VLFDAVYLDISQFTAEPLRTGVQRVLIRSLAHFPQERILPFRVVDAGHVAVLDPAVVGLCCRYFEAPSASRRDALRLSEAPGQASPPGPAHAAETLLIKLIAAQPLAVIESARFFRRARRIINLEAFGNAERARFYIGCPAAYRHKVLHFIHDFLLFEKPELFPQLNWRHAIDYVFLFEALSVAGGYLVATPELGQKVARYFNRPAADVHFVPFGGDLAPSPAAPPRPSIGKKRRRITVLGTIEPRKFPRLVAGALQGLATRHRDLDCVMIGSWGWVDEGTRAAIAAIFASGAVRHVENASDAALRALLAETDLAIYVSSAEGFGLPVIEFAALGVPLITNRAVPAAELVAAEAVVLDEVSENALIAAAEQLLQEARPRRPYYRWSWADSAVAILRAAELAMAEAASEVDLHAGWRDAMQLVRRLRAAKLDWETLKSTVAAFLAAERPALATLAVGARAELVEALSEIVSDNLERLHWADLKSAEPLLGELLAALAAADALDGLGRAFQAFLGRPIDPRAAAESRQFAPPARRLARIIEIIHCDEAGAFLGEAMSAALRHLIGAVARLLNATLDDRFDLFDLFAVLGLAPPTLADIRRAEPCGPAAGERLALLAAFASRRPVMGDAIDLLLEALAGFLLAGQGAPGGEGEERGGEREEEAREEGGSGGSPARVTTLALDSPLLLRGWYPLEEAGAAPFRWMESAGLIVNPDHRRPVAEVRLRIGAVYGAAEPQVAGLLGYRPASVAVRRDAASGEWLVSLAAAAAPVRAETVEVHSLASGCPAEDEAGSHDRRRLSLCLREVAFVYGGDGTHT